MKKTLLFLLLGILILTTFVSAYDSFIIINEGNSETAVIVSNLNSAEITERDETIIRILDSEGETKDLMDYIKDSNIKIVVIDNTSGFDLTELGTNIRRQTGVSVIVKFATGKRGENLEEINNTKVISVAETEETTAIETENLEEINNTKVIITSNVIKENSSENSRGFFLEALIIGLFVLIGFLILALVISRK